MWMHLLQSVKAFSATLSIVISIPNIVAHRLHVCLDDAQHGLEAQLQRVLGAAAGRGRRQVLQQQLVLGQPLDQSEVSIVARGPITAHLDRLEQVGGERQLVAEPALAGRQQPALGLGLGGEGLHSAAGAVHAAAVAEDKRKVTTVCVCDAVCMLCQELSSSTKFPQYLFK